MILPAGLLVGCTGTSRSPEPGALRTPVAASSTTKAEADAGHRAPLDASIDADPFAAFFAARRKEVIERLSAPPEQYIA